MKLNDKKKFCFIGLSIGSDSSNESGIAVIDRDLNLIKSDKAYQLSELKTIIANFSLLAPPENTIMCVDLPKNIMMLNGRWRIESKQTQVLTSNTIDPGKNPPWKKRYSDRGAELCNYFSALGMDVYRYNPYFTINVLRLNPPYRVRMPAGCKFLQSIIDEKLNIKGIPSNLLPLPVLLGLIGAFTGWKIATGEENVDYKQISAYKNMPVVSATRLNSSTQVI